MAITRTTLAGAMTSSDTVANLTSVTGVTTPNFQTASGIVYLRIDQEIMLVTFVPPTGTVVSVARGVNGTPAQAHVLNSLVQICGPSDLLPQTEQFVSSTTGLASFLAQNWPAIELAGATDAIPAGVAGNYVVKSGAINAMTIAAPTQAQEGNIITVFSDTLFAHTLTAASALFANGTALKTLATYPAFRGAGLVLRVCNLVYHVLSNGASAGVVVLS